uniref:Uncharacterized protein n=1 Tax=Anguilla anguilla TaxID=7936 RepID=A0A0E9QWS0_ANGAN
MVRWDSCSFKYSPTRKWYANINMYTEAACLRKKKKASVKPDLLNTYSYLHVVIITIPVS